MNKVQSLIPEYPELKETDPSPRSQSSGFLKIESKKPAACFAGFESSFGKPKGSVHQSVGFSLVILIKYLDLDDSLWEKSPSLFLRASLWGCY
ncbi:MAG TPA: hypothetical protein VHY08_29850, partial [Bacillota bacterium]|nr:hypothetical protein [Bacillota bacterium]